MATPHPPLPSKHTSAPTSLREVIDDFRKGLSGTGSPVWVRLHQHVQPRAPSACTLAPLIPHRHRHHPHTHTCRKLVLNCHVILFISRCLHYSVFPPAAVRVNGEAGEDVRRVAAVVAGVGRVLAWGQGEGTQRRGHRDQRVLGFFCGFFFLCIFFPRPFRRRWWHCGPAWGRFWQRPLRQIIERQMKTNDMIAERRPGSQSAISVAPIHRH